MLIVIEGIDGAGKNTQTRLLRERMEEAGRTTTSFSFPQYGQNPFSLAIARYLNGEFGGVNDVAPEMAAMLYAGDRFATRDALVAACAAHDLVICDRYVSSNLAHQAAKLPEERWPEFMEWLLDIEYKIFNMPKPELTLFLDVPPDTSQNLVMRKDKRDYTELRADIHEANAGYLERTRQAFSYLARNNVGGAWYSLQCTDGGGNMRSIEDIASELWQVLAPRLGV